MRELPTKQRTYAAFGVSAGLEILVVTLVGYFTMGGAWTLAFLGLGVISAAVAWPLFFKLSPPVTRD